VYSHGTRKQLSFIAVFRADVHAGRILQVGRNVCILLCNTTDTVALQAATLPTHQPQGPLESRRMLPNGPQRMGRNHKDSYSEDRSKRRASRVAARGAKLMVHSGRLYVSGRPWAQCLFWEPFDNCQKYHNRLREATKNRGVCLSWKSQCRQNVECFCESRLYIKRNKGITSDTLHHIMDFGIHICHTFSVQQFFPFTILN